MYHVPPSQPSRTTSSTTARINRTSFIVPRLRLGSRAALRRVDLADAPSYSLAPTTPAVAHRRVQHLELIPSPRPDRVCESGSRSVYRGMTSNPSFDERFIDVHAGCWTPVFRFALSLTNEWDAAEDLAQEAFARLWIHRTDVDWSRPLLPWLLTTTRRLAFDRFRRLRPVPSRAGTAMRREHSTAMTGSAGSTSSVRWRRWLRWIERR